MTDKFTHDDEALRRAVGRLPEAPPDPGFAARVMARAAVTPQCDAAGALAGRAAAGLRPVIRFAWAAAGFSLGVAIFISAYFSLLGAAVTDANNGGTPAPAVTQSVMVFDPLEAALTDQWNGSGGEAGR